jgi:DNA-binding transcriptional regulator YdaS (Cro superfamily)
MEHVIDRLGGPSVVARMCNVSSPSVTNWRKRGIPIERCVPIERATSGAVMRWDLRPTDWWEIWPELTARPDAPPISAPAAATEAALQINEQAHPTGSVGEVRSAMGGACSPAPVRAAAKPMPQGELTEGGVMRL